jgi:hypothetical protein
MDEDEQRTSIAIAFNAVIVELEQWMRRAVRNIQKRADHSHNGDVRVCGLWLTEDVWSVQPVTLP